MSPFLSASALPLYRIFAQFFLVGGVTISFIIFGWDKRAMAGKRRLSTSTPAAITDSKRAKARHGGSIRPAKGKNRLSFIAFCDSLNLAFSIQLIFLSAGFLWLVWRWSWLSPWTACYNIRFCYFEMSLSLLSPYLDLVYLQWWGTAYRKAELKSRKTTIRVIR